MCVGLELAARICDAELTGASKGSTDVTFVPRGRESPQNHFTADVLTAGSTTLLLQIALPLLLFSDTAEPTSLTLKGGTNATQAPQVDYTQHVLLRFLERHIPGPQVSLSIKRRGYFPKGGGEIHANVTPTAGKLPAFNIVETNSRIAHIVGVAHVGGLPYDLGKRMAKAARTSLVRARCLPDDITVRIEVETCEVKGPGSGIVLWAEREDGAVIGGSSVGKKGEDSSKTGELAADELLRALQDGGCADEWLQDQLIIFMALAEGSSSLQCGKGGLTLHTR